ncbi:ABC transporter substrate-binding protein [Haloarcula argentinensis]|uniref:ABC transporter substrate-binding protein n=1 Tax=Haloarcula argentinensis TaxID=43776 RepID=A0A847U5S2_HALAR|nr:ABC transporter substrate-binding protein [Haloarcula argentinensis]NLV13622.1 ABC transporter substrate-binding protein [Haloarcula argentinensis]
MADPTSTPSDRSTAYTNSIGRRSFIRAAGASAALGLFAGCSGDGGGGGENPDGGGGISETVTIGHLAPLNNPLGIGSKRSAEMAVAEINDDGGIADQTVELVTKDTRASPSEARTVAGELVRQEEVDAIVGTFSSEVTQSIMDLVSEFNTPFLVTGSAAPSTVTEFVASDYERYKNTFRVGPVNSHFQAEVISQYASHLSDRHGWNTFAVVADDAEWTTVFRNRLVDLLREADLDVPMVNGLATDTTSFGSVLDDVDEVGADAMFRFFAHINGGPMAARWAEGEYEFGIEGVHVASMLPAYYQLTEGAAAYETTTQSGAAGVTDITSKTVPFTESYMEEYGDADDPPSKPMYMGFVTYDAIHVFKNAAERAGTVDQENNLDAIVDALLQTDFTGTAGQVQFYGADETYAHDLREKRDSDGIITNYPLTQWREGGSLECVYPEGLRTAEHAAPPWMG